MFLAINLNVAKAKKRKKQQELERELAAKHQIIMQDGVSETIAMEMRRTTTTNLDNIIGKGKFSKCKECKHLIQTSSSSSSTSSTGNGTLEEQEQQQQQKQQKRLTRQHHRSSSVGNEGSRLPLTQQNASCHCSCNCNCIYKMQSCVQKQQQHRDSLTSVETIEGEDLQYHHHHHNRKSTTNIKTSLFTVYICLGTLMCALATLSVLFYSHVTSQSTMPTDNTYEYVSIRKQTNEFRVNFQRELAASEQILQNMVEHILQKQQKQQSTLYNELANFVYNNETAASHHIM